MPRESVRVNKRYVRMSGWLFDLARIGSPCLCGSWVSALRCLSLKKKKGASRQNAPIGPNHNVHHLSKDLYQYTPTSRIRMPSTESVAIRIEARLTSLKSGTRAYKLCVVVQLVTGPSGEIDVHGWPRQRRPPGGQ